MSKTWTGLLLWAAAVLRLGDRASMICVFVMLIFAGVVSADACEQTATGSEVQALPSGFGQAGASDPTGCGPPKEKWKALRMRRQKSAGVVLAPSSGRVTLVFLFRYPRAARIAMLGAAPGGFRIAIDGTWVLLNVWNTFSLYDVAPGFHRVCVQFSFAGNPLVFAFTAEEGGVYLATPPRAERVELEEARERVAKLTYVITERR